MLVRPSVVSPAGGAIVVAGVAATSFMARGDNYRYGIQNEAGEVPLLGDFRVMALLGALGVNFLPWVAEQLLPFVGDIPVVGQALDFVAFGIPRGLQDHAQLLGLVAGISFVATEAMAAQETGQFASFDLPGFLLGDGEDDEAIEEAIEAIAPAVAAVEDNVIPMDIAAG
jgi:hypothetical protein